MKCNETVCLIISFFSMLSVRAQTVNFTSSNLPIVIINTNGQDIPDDPKITADMGIIYNGASQRNNIADPYNNYNGKIGIEIRGHSSQMFPMKSYSVELHDSLGNSVDQSILGMPKESDWVLYAPYTDKTLMRNFLTYTLSQELGHWAAHCQFVEVVLNGDYAGVYVLMEKIKRNKARVNIAKMDNFNIAGDEVTGGYIFSLDKDPNAWFSQYLNPGNPSRRCQFSFVYPKTEDIVQEQAEYIKSFVDSFENALGQGIFADTVHGYRKFADVISFQDYFFINEVSRNVDAYRLSSFFYKDRDSKDGRIHAGPVWDYDLAFRNANYCSGSDIAGWAYNFNYVCSADPSELVPFWWEQFMKDTAYTGQLRCRWKAVRQTTMSINNINHLIDSVTNLVNEAQQRHFQRWPVLGQYIWPNPDPIPGSYNEEISALKNWISLRLDWMDQNMPNNGSCSDFPPDVRGNIVVSTNPNPFPSNLTVSVLSKIEQTLFVEAFDMNGKSLLAYQYQIQAGSNELPLPTDRWARGQYILRITTSNGDKIIRKIMKN